MHKVCLYKSVEHLPGDRVRHPGQPGWGVGQVLDGASATRAPVFFVNGKRKVLSFKHVTLVKVDGTEAENALLDNLCVSDNPDFHYISMPEAIHGFTVRYAQGFADPTYLEQERAPKEKVRELFEECLAKESFSQLVQDERFQEICELVLRIAKATHLIFPNEKSLLRKGLKQEENQPLFAKNLFSFLYGTADEKVRSEAFFNCLKKLKAAKWTIATFFPCMAFPQEKLLLKPPITKPAAERSAFDLAYEATPNWKTYNHLQCFAQYLINELTSHGLPPKDMFDVHAFVTSIARESA